MSKQPIIFWQQHESQWKDSALTQAQYCKKHQLNPQRLSHHKRKLETQETALVKTGFIALPIPEYLPKPEKRGQVTCFTILLFNSHGINRKPMLTLVKRTSLLRCFDITLTALSITMLKSQQAL